MMAGTYQLNGEPAVIDLGPHGRAVVLATVPFVVGDEQHCANYPHLIEGFRPSSGRRRDHAVVQALAARKGSRAGEGTITVWPKG